MAMLNVLARQSSFVSEAEAPVVARARVLKPEVEKPCVEVRTWGKAEEMEARAWLRRIVAIVGEPEAARLAGIAGPEFHRMNTGGSIDAETGERLLAVDMPEGEPTTREQRRSRRARSVRARTISVKRMTKREIELGAMLNPEDNETREMRAERPVTRADCAGGIRPCPWVSCAHHLYIDVQQRTGAIKLNFPDIEVEDMHESCSLDIADREGETLEKVGEILNLTRERVRQLEVRGMAKIAALQEAEVLRGFVDEGPAGKRRLPVLQMIRGGRDEAEGMDDCDESEAT